MFMTRYRSIAILLLAALALPAVPASGQTAQQPAQPPVTPSPATMPPPAGPQPLPTVPPVPAAATGPALSLADAITTALQHNFTVQQAAIAVALARAQLAQAQAQIQPALGFNGTYTQTWAPGATPGTLSGTINIPSAGINGQSFNAVLPSGLGGTGISPWSLGLKLQYPLYTGNALQDQIAIARANVQGAEAAFAATANVVVLQTRQAYYSVQLAQGQVAAQVRAVTAAQENVRVTQARVNVGTSPRFDLLQALVQLAQSQQALTRTRTNAVQAEQNLDVVLNQPLTVMAAPATPLGLAAPPPDLEGLVAQALVTRPELAQARASIQAAQSAIDLAAAGLRPNITLNGGPNIQTSDPTTHTPVVWSAAAVMTLAILDGGLTRAKIEAARQQLAQAQTSDAQTRQTIEQQVRTAYLGLEAAAEELRSAEAGLAAATEALRIANVRFQAGVGTQLEVVTAEQNLATADTAVVQAQFDYNLALAQLDQAVGIQVKV
jgi:outer membrane protein TolC